MKICCIADIHVGVKSYSKIDPVTHFSYRELETIKNLRQVVDNCISQNIPVLLIAGDVYHTSITSPSLQNEVNKIIYYASTNNIIVLILDGNHDLKKIDTAVSALKPVDTFQLKNIVHTKTWLDKEIFIGNETTRFIFLPTYSTNEQIKQLLDEHIPIDNNYQHPIVVIGHLTMQGASLNDWLIAENEEYIDINIFKNRNINFVVLGHLHKPQVLLKQDPFIFYTGSLQRIDFNEEFQKKGYWIIDTSNNTSQFIEMDMQKFYTISVNIQDNHIPVLQQIIKSINKSKVEDAIVRVIITTYEHLKLTIEEETELKQLLYDLKASSVLMIKQKIMDNHRSRNIELNETISINKSLEIYYNNQIRSAERIKLGQSIISQYKNSFV